MQVFVNGGTSIPLDEITATKQTVLEGAAFINNEGELIIGDMPNRGAVTATYTPSTSIQTYTIPAGYHNGSGKVTINAAPVSLINGTATAAQVLSGYTFFSDSYIAKTGTMTNNGAVNTSIGVGGSYTIPAGYHNGSGKVSGPALSGNATTGAVLSGYTFYSNSGTKQTGTMTNRGALTLTTSNISNGAILIPAGYHNGSGTVGIKTSLTSFSGDLLIRSYGNSSTPIGVFRNGTSGSYTYSGSQYPYIIRLAEGTTYDTCLILCYIGKDYVI